MTFTNLNATHLTSHI